MTQSLAFPEVLDAIRTQTTRLLGTTIEFDEDDWAAPTVLPGWTRSHVAAHLVEQARRLTKALSAEQACDPEPDPASLRCQWERQAIDEGLTLQIRLDESAGQLQDALAGLGRHTETVRIADGWTGPASLMPALRLRELVVHHFDLIGREALDVPTSALLTIAEFETLRPRNAGLPPVLLVADEGFSARIGADSGDTTTVIGPLPDLCLWLARGIASDHISGASAVPMPLST
ncbi:maleylpyruvate isomerase family mycothiol-dependent enzyme [uncultured Tessaracoccus sp.]|uniref:maleylpyruvate isomerase family mycothiol-dependent enzyme n=1 Tax=uncultured Tessaracoccus sp. TaxID=905023 RepID=UPI00262F9180|nr:maleylpyruvate isomerase family mycothiol-dependent enzyme [uncultured Tessaracoccus sp.]